MPYWLTKPAIDKKYKLVRPLSFRLDIKLHAYFLILINSTVHMACKTNAERK